MYCDPCQRCKSGKIRHMAKARESRSSRAAPKVFPGPDHDHGRCSSDAMAIAEAQCLEQRPPPDADPPAGARRRCSAAISRSAPTRSWSGSRPKGPRPAPITVYRALEFLRENGLIHRIESRNAFVACVHNHAERRAGGVPDLRALRRRRRGRLGRGRRHPDVGGARRRLHAEIAGDRDRRHLRPLPLRLRTGRHVDAARPVWHCVSSTGTSVVRQGGPRSMSEAAPQERRQSVAVDVGGVTVGGDAPIVVQSMTNTDTADVAGTTAQVAALARAGSEIVRITVDRDEAAAAVPHIKERLLEHGRATCRSSATSTTSATSCWPIIRPAREALDKYRINPGNVGFKDKKDRQFGAIVETAIRHGKPVRIGANWGSLDQELLTHLMDENSRSPAPLGRARGDARGDGAVGADSRPSAPRRSGLRATASSCPPRCRRCRISIAVYAELARALRLCAASRPHRGRHGLQGHRRLVRRHGRAAAAGHRRHHPRLAHARARRRPHASR